MGQGIRSWPSDFDENINNLSWTPNGIYGTAWQKTVRPIVRIDPEIGEGPNPRSRAPTDLEPEF